MGVSAAAQDLVICHRDLGHSHVPGKWLPLLLSESKHTNAWGDHVVTLSTDSRRPVALGGGPEGGWEV